jgi:uncharacterized membrane protein YedE/YeeE
MGLLLLLAVMAFVTGMCIQRASICAVRATEQWVRHRRTSRLRAFLSAAAWAGVVVLPLAWVAPERAMLASDAPISWLALSGGALFGLGAGLNGGCALGTVAQLTRGRIEYVGTLAGIFLGAAAAVVTGLGAAPSRSSILSMSGWAALVVWAGFGVLVFPAMVAHLRRPRPRFTTITCFAVLGVLGGLLQAVASNWTYTSLLSGWAEQAFGSASGRPPTVASVCTLSLLAGGTAMAIRLRRFRLGRPTAWRCCATVCGGALMGFAAMMIPGGNDALLLSGLPSLSRNALAAYIAMVGSLAILLTIRRAWARQPAHPADGKAN